MRRKHFRHQQSIATQELGILNHGRFADGLHLDGFGPPRDDAAERADTITSQRTGSSLFVALQGTILISPDGRLNRS